MASKAGHDLVFDVVQWDATLVVAEDGGASTLELNGDGSHLSVQGELTMAGSAAPVNAEVAVEPDGHVAATIALTQSQ